MTPPRWQRHGARSIRSETWLTPRIASFCPARYPVCTGQTSTPRGSRQRPRRWQCGALAERRTGIELTVIAFDVTLKMPTSRQGTAAFYPPLRLALPWEERETPHAKSPSLRGFLFWQAEPVRRDPNCFGAEGGNPSAECLKYRSRACRRAGTRPAPAGRRNAH